MQVGLKAEGKGEIPLPGKEDVCATPICVPAMLGGVGINLGVRLGMANALKLEFEAKLELTYKRTITSTGARKNAPSWAAAPCRLRDY